MLVRALGPVFAIALALLACAAGAVAAPPPNDDFANAVALRDSGRNDYGTGELEEATREAGEPVHAGWANGASVWFRWTAMYTGTARVHACHGNVHPAVAVYTGSSVGALTLVSTPTDVAGPEFSRCTLGDRGGATLQAVAGQTYAIAVALASGERGWFELEALDAPIPPFSAATPWIGPARIKGRRAKIRFDTGYAFATFLCQLDGGKKLPCTSPVTYTNLRPGRHRVAITAVGDPGAAVQAPAVRRFWVPKPKPKPRAR